LARSEPLRGGKLMQVPQQVPAPIVTCHLWYDRPSIQEKALWLLGSTYQVVFNYDAFRKPSGPPGHLAMVISAANEEIRWTQDQLVQKADSELRLLCPEIGQARLVRSIVMKEMWATSSSRVGEMNSRPDVRTGYDGLWWAGDWTATMLPGTIEGAVVSGRDAARGILSSQTRRDRGSA
jgi:zeta-carotene desaturase